MVVAGASGVRRGGVQRQAQQAGQAAQLFLGGGGGAAGVPAPVDFPGQVEQRRQRAGGIQVVVHSGGEPLPEGGGVNRGRIAGGGGRVAGAGVGAAGGSVGGCAVAGAIVAGGWRWRRRRCRGYRCRMIRHCRRRGRGAGR